MKSDLREGSLEVMLDKKEISLLREGKLEGEVRIKFLKVDYFRPFEISVSEELKLEIYHEIDSYNISRINLNISPDQHEELRLQNRIITTYDEYHIQIYRERFKKSKY